MHFNYIQDIFVWEFYIVIQVWDVWRHISQAEGPILSWNIPGVVRRM